MKRNIILFTLFLSFLRLHAQVNHPFLIFLSNDVCADYTWGLKEDEVHDAVAELIKAHLDEMNRTENFPFHIQDRYTCTITNELLFFLDKYPNRKEELYSRIHEGKIMISPFLSNSMWGFQSAEGFLRCMYPAQRLAKACDVQLKWAVHSELPSMPQGIAPLLTGSGITWICKPYLNYDAHFEGLSVPPVFILQGPDSSMLKVSMDNWASNHFVYAQGAGILKLPFYQNDTSTIEGYWLPHYSSLQNYPMNAALAEGTHFDLSPESKKYPSIITHRIDSLNKVSPGKYQIINSTFAMYADYVDSIEREHHFLQTFDGSFGVTWESWPAGLAKYVSGYREQERRLLMTEAKMVLKGIDFHQDTTIYRLHRKAEWCLGMLADHAWNGSDTSNITENARIRKSLVDQLESSISAMETIIVQRLPIFTPKNESKFTETKKVKFANPFYILAFGKKEKGLESIISKETGEKFQLNKTAFISVEYLIDSTGYYFKPGTIAISENQDTLIIRQKGELAGLICEFYYYLYEHSDRVDLTIRIQRPSHCHREALFAHFGLKLGNTLLHAETTGAIIEPYLIPKGNLLPGADTTRTVVQGFVSAESLNMPCLTIIPLDAFLLRTDGELLTFELFGNDQNYREAIKNQNNETEFCFRFSMQVTENYNQEEAFEFSRSVMFDSYNFQLGSQNNPLSAQQASDSNNRQYFVITCLKPAEPEFGEGIIIRLWESTGRSGNTTFTMDHPYKVYLCSLLEETQKEIPLINNTFQLYTKGNGFVCLRLL